MRALYGRIILQACWVVDCLTLFVPSYIAGHRDLHGAPFLVLANKHDMPGALSAIELKSLLGLAQFGHSREIDVQPCSALTGERVASAVEWLVVTANQSSRKDLLKYRQS